MTTGEIMALAHLYRNATEIAEPRKALRTAIEAIVAASQGEQAKVPLPPDDWSVYNTGAEVASGLSYAEAMDYLTPERIARGWNAVIVVDKSNIKEQTT